MIKILRTALLLLLFGNLACASAQQPSPTPTPAPQQSPAREKAVGVGDIAPDFALEDEQGRKVALADARGKEPVVLVFYRGYW